MPIRVTVELIPHGDESQKRIVGRMDIENTADHPKRPWLADYKYQIEGPVIGGGVETWHVGKIHDFKRSQGYWACVKAVLNAIDVNYLPSTD